MAKIPGIHQTATLNLTGSGNFTGGTIKVDRVGNQVTISVLTTLTHASLVQAISGAILPSWAIPTSARGSVPYVTAGVITRIQVTEAGDFRAAYFNDTFATLAQTTTNLTSTISYNIG